MEKNNIIIRAENLTVSFKSKNGKTHKAADSINLSLKEGETLAIVGESGSGKTTLMRAIMGLAELACGKISLFGLDTDKLTRGEYNRIRRQCGYIPQDPYGSIPPGLSVIDAVTEPAVIADAPLTKSERTERARTLLASLGLTEERILASRAAEISGGQRQRVEIARALMLSPKLLLCDEPTSMQDVSTRGEIIEILAREVSKGMSMIFVTHDLLLAGHAAGRIAVMKEGKICEEGTSEEVLKNPSHPYTKTLLASVPKLQWRS